MVFQAILSGASEIANTGLDAYKQIRSYRERWKQIREGGGNIQLAPPLRPQAESVGPPTRRAAPPPDPAPASSGGGLKISGGLIVLLLAAWFLLGRR